MVLKRVFIGGLYPGVTENELKQRFSSYGAISDIEVKVKKDVEGNPVKTFAYMDIDSSDADIKKCFRTYNKTKWKGSELSLQFAKENFVKRLEEERKDQQTSPDTTPSKSKKVPKGSAKKGDSDVNMKGAVPGTSVPGQKDWTVGKYGRVLPVVNIRSKDKRKLLKVDPSKYTHNVRRMKDDQAQEADLVETDKLTWELGANDNELTKKRKGEFTAWKSSKRKFEPKEDSAESDSEMEVVPVSDYSLNTSRLNESLHFSEKKKSDIQKETSSNKKKLSNLQTNPSKTSSLAKKNKSQQIKLSKLAQKGQLSNSDDGYDSGDTDEIIAVSKRNKIVLELQKNSLSNSNSENGSAVESRIQINPLQGKLVSLAMSGNSQTWSTSKAFHDKNIENIKMKDNKTKNLGPFGSKPIKPLDIEESHLPEFKGTRFLDDDDDFKSVETDTVRTMISHGSEKVMKHQDKAVRDFHSESEHSDSDFETLIKKGVGTVSHATPTELKHSVRNKESKFQRRRYTGTGDDIENDDTNSVSSADTDEILFSLKRSKQTKAFKFDKSSKQHITSSKLILNEFSSGLNSDSEMGQDFQSSDSKFKSSEDTSDEESDFEVLVKNELRKLKNKDKQNKNMQSSVNKRTSEKESFKIPCQGRNLHENKKVTSAETNLGKNIHRPDKYSSIDTTVVDTRLQELADSSGDMSNLSMKPVKEQGIDKKRLETVKQRQKEYLAQKSVIQKALSNLDKGQSSNKKIVFDSDDDSDGQETGGLEIHNKHNSEEEEDTFNKNLMNGKKSAGIGLFDDSSEESPDEEGDGDRFKLRPEFEGSAGKKLMKLQSRYGNDERFKLDTRFAESDSESEENNMEEEDEKTKQMKILASVLGTTAGITLDKRDKAKKTFKDVSQLHFDPTKEEHKQFEIMSVKKPMPEKNEKKKKKKKSEEAEADTDPQLELPEVSKERFFEVSDSLKNTFAKKSEDESKGFSLLAAFGRRDNDSDDEMDDGATAKPFTATVDKLTLDDRFKVTEDDSEKEDDDAMDVDSVGSDTVNTADAAPDFIQPSTFFFMDDDLRLKEGEKFYRTEDMETVRERWLEKRSFYVESYTSKHKKFRRKLRTMQKSRPGSGKKSGGYRKQKSR